MFEIGDRVQLSWNGKDAVILGITSDKVKVYALDSGTIHEELNHNKVYKQSDEAYIVRQHADTWCSVRMGKYMYLLCIGAESVNDDSASVVIMDMKKGVIVHKSDDEIIQMIRENRDASDDEGDYSDDEMMFDYARNEYI